MTDAETNGPKGKEKKGKCNGLVWQRHAMDRVVLKYYKCTSPLSRNFFPPFGLAACRGREASSLPPPGFFVSSLYPFRAREVRVSQPLGLFGVSSLPRNYSGGGVLPSLVRLDYGGLCSFF